MLATRTGAAGIQACKGLTSPLQRGVLGLQSIPRIAPTCQAALMALPSQVSHQNSVRTISCSALSGYGFNSVQRSGRTSTVVVKSTTVEVAETEQTTPVLEGFSQLGLSAPLQEALAALRIDKPTEVQVSL